MQRMVETGASIAPQTHTQSMATRVMLVLTAVFAALAAAGTASTSFARTASTASAASAAIVRVHGKMTGRKGAPLIGADVALEASRPEATRRTHTNATGGFAFDGVETGGYRLRVRYRETDASGQVDVQEDKQVDIALDIDP